MVQISGKESCCLHHDEAISLAAISRSKKKFSDQNRYLIWNSIYREVLIELQDGSLAENLSISFVNYFSYLGRCHLHEADRGERTQKRRGSLELTISEGVVC